MYHEEHNCELTVLRRAYTCRLVEDSDPRYQRPQYRSVVLSTNEFFNPNIPTPAREDTIANGNYREATSTLASHATNVCEEEEKDLA